MLVFKTIPNPLRYSKVAELLSRSILLVPPAEKEAEGIIDPEWDLDTLNLRWDIKHACS